MASTITRRIERLERSGQPPAAPEHGIDMPPRSDSAESWLEWRRYQAGEIGMADLSPLNASKIPWFERQGWPQGRRA